jgi:GNAT superfamily N-acetyltransferase
MLAYVFCIARNTKEDIVEIFHTHPAEATKEYASLFAAAFGRTQKLSDEYLNWQYFLNPDGEAISSNAYSDAILAAHYSVLPRSFSIGADSILGSISVNTATHPSFQGKGLFVKLAERTYERAASIGVKFVIGVANANSIGGFIRKLGFSNVGNVRLAFGALPARSSYIRGLETKRIERWWQWRLANPSAKYWAIKSGSDVLIQTDLSGTPFNLGFLPFPNHYPTLRSRTTLRKRVALTPVFPRGDFGLCVPLQLQPSPWHVIIRSLDNTPHSQFSDVLKLCGIDMDTF